jgi:hypothetical protein
MAAHETPLQAMKRLYGNKEKLVDSLVGSLRGAEEEAGELKERLLKASNKQLLRLSTVAKTMGDKYGSRDKLAAALAETVGKAKDSGYVTKLREMSAPKLLDMMTSASKRAADAARTVKAGAARPAKSGGASGSKASTTKSTAKK